jgi:uncharacterized protein YgbK (DUF1537 family)
MSTADEHGELEAVERNPLVEQHHLMEVWRLTVLGLEGGVIVQTMYREHGVPVDHTRKLLRIVRSRLHTVARKTEQELVHHVRRQQLDRLTYAAQRVVSTGIAFAGDGLVALESAIARLAGTEAPKEHRVQMESRSLSVHATAEVAASTAAINARLLELRDGSQGARAIAHEVDVARLGVPQGGSAEPMSTVGLGPGEGESAGGAPEAGEHGGDLT